MCVVVGVAIVALYQITLSRGRADWERYARAARERGVKLSLAEWIPHEIPAEENFAAIPVFAQPKSESGQRNQREMFPGKPPAFVSGRDCQSIDFEAWRRYCVEQKWVGADSTEPAAAAVLSGLQKRFAGEWEQLRVAASRPRSRFPVDWKKGFAVQTPHLGPLLTFAKLAALRGQAHAALGDAAHAFEDATIGLRLASAIHGEPTLISHLVGAHLMGFGLATIRGGLERHIWDDAALQALDVQLKSMRPLEHYRFALQSERGFNNDMYDTLRQKGFPDVAPLLALGDTSEAPLSLMSRIYPRGWTYDNERRSNQGIDKLLDRIDTHSGRFVPEKSEIAANLKPRTRWEGLHYFIYFVVQPVVMSTEATALREYTLVQCARIGLALERWRLVHEDLPAELQELGTDLPNAQDVISGEPLHYRTTPDGGYIVYSIALNRKDDGGDDGAKNSAMIQPDWVWRICAR
jgi:hypothetical protein